MSENFEGLKQQINALLGQIGAFYDNSISADPAAQAEALAQLQAWRQQFEAATGYALTDEIEQLPKKLKEAADSDHRANLRHSADAINQFVEQLKSAGADDTQNAPNA